MERKWSKEQKQIIDELRKENVLVAAAAGSGKTTVLVERIKKLVCQEGVPLKSLLVVTFTKAAAAEMKEKIRKALRKELKEATGKDPDKANYLRSQLRDIGSSDISTFDSFALNVVRRYFFKTDLEPGFGVLDEAKKVLMIEDSLDLLLEEEFREMTPEFRRLMDKYCSDRNPDKIRDLVSDTYTRIMAMPHPWDWLEEQVDILKITKEDFPSSKLWKLVREDIIRALRNAVDEERKAKKYLEDSGLRDVARELEEKELKRYENALNVALEEENPTGFMEKLNLIFSQASARIGAKGEEKEPYNLIKDGVKSQRDRAKEYIEGIKKDYLLASLNLMLEEMNDTAGELETVIHLLKRFHRIFGEAKAEARTIDFADMEHYCLEILEDPEIAQEYKNRFNYIFIDEYQDTNGLQEAIVNLIKRENNLFMVGDVKQSIYGFRLAEPTIFQNKYKDYSLGTEPSSTVVDLNKNYRSKEGIIKGVNQVFSGMMEGYDERAELHKGVEYDGPHTYYPEIKMVTSEGPRFELDEEAASGQDNQWEGQEQGDNYSPGEDLGEEELTPETKEKTELEAEYVARLIKEHLGKPFFDGETQTVRGLEPRDIVILLRSIKGYGEIYSDALSEVGIESYSSESSGYFDTMEIDIFMNLLSVIDNRRRDVELLSVLHSDIFGFSAEELGEIRRLNKRGDYIDAFLAYGEEGPVAELKEKCHDAMAQIEEWRTASRVMPLPRFIWQVLNESGFYLVMGAMPGGNIRQANLRALVDRAESFGEERQASLYSFVRYVGELKKREVATPEVKLIGEGDQVVRIMTIHKSKGLEFPMVIVAGAGRRLRYSNRGDSLVFHREIGMGMTYVNYEDSWYRRTLPQNLIFRKILQEEEQEQERVLYVALTRAKDYLYVVGTLDKVEDYELGRELNRRGHGSFLDMIGNTLPFSEASVEGEELEEETLLEDETSKEEGFAEEVADERRDSILEQLSYIYPYAEERTSKSKYSVSELNARKRGEEKKEREPELAVPAFAREKRTLTGAEKGTVYHSIMEYMDFGKALAEGYAFIEQTANTMVKEGLLTEEELKAVDLKKVEGFFLSDLGKRAAAAWERGQLHKERPFTLKEKVGEEDVLVQGIIDCYFKENGKTILLDYKSNYIENSSPSGYAELLDKYRIQLEIYREALEKAGEGPVEEVYLYLFSKGEALKA